MDQRRLPQGIRMLRRFKVDNGAAISRYRFERLVNSLDKCAANSKPKAIKCDSCPYLGECLERFDGICGRVVTYRRKHMVKKVS